MPERTGALVLEIDKPHFSIKLFTDLLKMDLKGGAKNEIEEALENKPVLRETLGAILGIFAPLHIRLSDIDSASADEKGRVKIVLPHRRDVTIPLNPDEANKLAVKLNELIPDAKRKEVLRVMRESRIEKAAEEHVEAARPAAEYPIQFQSELEEPEVVEDVGEAEELEEKKEED